MKQVYKFALAASALAMAGQAQAVTLTNATLFAIDATGTNLSATVGNPITEGAWTTALGTQNVPGNYAALLFLATSPNPSPASFLTPNFSNSITLQNGLNTFYFWGNGDGTGGNFGHGLNLFLNGAGPISPSLSAIAVPGAGPAATVNGSTGCTSGSNLICTPSAGTLTSGMVTLTNFQVFARGGGNGGEDRVNSTNTMLFVPPPQADGVNDTYGSFTLVYNAPVGGVPEPATWAMMLAGFGFVGGALRTANGRRRSKVAVTYA